MFNILFHWLIVKIHYHTAEFIFITVVWKLYIS
jgi:hypothetical protein